ncbi:MAG TPA: hypothetical protein VEJ21_02090 [Acidimicrobiales bacterium]|nr:hypothetical protein [Acidimicrobiales bacterium]
MGQEPPGGDLPPADPEAWTDEQWLDWLARTEPEESAEHQRVVARWRERPSASVLGAAMLGLRDAIYGRPDEDVVIVADAPGDPPDDDAPIVRLDPEHPERSEVVVRALPSRRRRRPRE